MRYSSLRLYAVAILVMLLVTVAASPARAQFIGFTSPQTTQQTLATGQACTGGAIAFTPMNLGQNQHFVTFAASVTTTNARVNIFGVDGASTFQIGDTLFVSAGGIALGYGTGYFPIVRVTVDCTGGTFSLAYSGTSSNTPVISGDYLRSQQVKELFRVAAANVNQSLSNFRTPYANASGTVIFSYATAAVAASSLTFTCTISGGSEFVQTFALANATGTQVFKVPPANCPLMAVSYTSGGATAGLIALDYSFDVPGTGLPETANYVHIAGTTATAVKAATGVLTSLTINTAAAGTVTLHDLATAACTATPATEIVGVITAIAGASPSTHSYNLFFRNGICVKASAIMDITVGVQ